MITLRSRSLRVTVVAALLVSLTFGAFTVAEAGLNLGRLFRKTAKIVGISGLVRVFADRLDSFINVLLVNKKVENRQKTRVVPIFSMGERKAVGACQVSGDAEALGKVRQVYAYEDIFQRGQFRIKALVPGDSANPEKFDRVYGVGVTAIIDVKI